MEPAAPARGARAFDATLSVPGREELQQTGMRVRVLPAPAWTPCASREADEAGETNALLRAGAPATSAREASSEARADGTKKNATEDASNLDSNLDASSPFAPPPDAWSTPLTPEVLGEMTVIGFWEPGRGLDPLPALYLMAGGRGPSARLVGDADATSANGTAVGVEALHAELSEKMKTAVVSIAGGRREVHLCAIPPTDDSAPDGETATAARDDDADVTEDRKKNGFHFLAFETRAMAPFHHAPILVSKQLPVIFDLDETLLQAFTLSSLDRRAEAIRRAHSESAERAEGASLGGDEKTRADVATDAAGKTVAGALGSFASDRRGGADATRGPVDARVARQRREEDMARLKHDRAMLAQYVAENCVTDNRGRRHAAAAESATTAPGEVTFRPVIRLPSPHCRGGQMIFTRIDPANVGTSMLVHVRPGWEEMHGYLAGLDRRADGERKTQNARCAAFVCTMSEAQYAQEMWRLLDPRGALIAPKDLAQRVVSVKQGAELKTLEKAVGPWGIAKELCVVLDDRTAVWEPRARPHILAVAPFMPYATDTGPGLRGEAPGEAGVLGAARRMLEKTRMDLYMTYERFARFHAKFPNAPFEPPAGLVNAVSESVRESEPLFKTSRPQPPDVGETLPPLMNAHAKEAARAVAQMGGAARSAAGAGSRLNAMLGGIAAPRVAGAVKTLASASFVKNAGVSGGAGEHEKRDPSAPESGAGAGDDAREKAKAAAVAAMKLAAEKEAREKKRAERERKNVPASAAGDERDGDGSEGPGPGVDSDEERVRKEDADAEAALGESSESDAEPDARTRASARAPGDASVKATNGAEKEAPRKRRYTCSTCAAHDLTPTDHFRFGKSCPFHPEYKAKEPKKHPEYKAKKPEKKKQTREEMLLEAQRAEQEAERELMQVEASLGVGAAPAPSAKTPSVSAPAKGADGDATSSSSDSGSSDSDSDSDSYDSAEGGGSNPKGAPAAANGGAAAGPGPAVGAAARGGAAAVEVSSSRPADDGVALKQNASKAPVTVQNQAGWASLADKTAAAPKEGAEAAPGAAAAIPDALWSDFEAMAQRKSDREKEREAEEAAAKAAAEAKEAAALADEQRKREAAAEKEAAARRAEEEAEAAKKRAVEEERAKARAKLDAAGQTVDMEGQREAMKEFEG